jgi:periplasmic mercuric ion binding protein
MKTLRSAAILFLFILIAFAANGCGDKKSTQDDKKQSTEKDQNQTANMISDGKYFCPMHPTQQTDDSAVRCPICKMKLTSKADYNKKMSEEHEAMEKKYAGKNDLIHFEVKLSVIKSDECQPLLEAALSKDKGVVEYHIEIVNRIIHMYIDKAKTTKSNVEKLISEAGFDANDTKATADAVSKLPAECK